MATTEILLVKPVEHLGHEGEQLKVRAGYARNYLLPRNLAVPVTLANRKQVESLQKIRESRLAKELAGAQDLAAKIAKVSIAIAVKTGPGGKLFGAVTNADLIKRLADEGVNLPEKTHVIKEAVKTLGKHVASFKLHADVPIEFSFEVVSENPIEEDPSAAPAAAPAGEKKNKYRKSKEGASEEPAREEKPSKSAKEGKSFKGGKGSKS